MELQGGPGCVCKGVRTCLSCEKCRHEGFRKVGAKCLHTFMYNQATRRAELLLNDGTVLYFDFPGIEVFESFLSSTEEEELVAQIDTSPWKNSQSGRRKQDYGPKVNFKKRRLKLGAFNGLPAFSKAIVERFRSDPGLANFEPVELCNLEYVPERGSSIDPHFDDNWLWGERLITLNLLSNTSLTMVWSGEVNEAPELIGRDLHGIDLNDVAVKIELKRRSLTVLSGSARHHWMHGIERSDIKNRRLCCTFRELSDEFLFGAHKEEGRKLLAIANKFDGDIIS